MCWKNTAPYCQIFLPPTDTQLTNQFQIGKQNKPKEIEFLNQLLIGYIITVFYLPNILSYTKRMPEI